MAFNPEKYMTDEFEDRVIDYPVPDLAPWCDGEAVFKLRGLTGVELAQVRENLNRRKAAQKLLGEAESKSLDKAITDAARVILGLVGDKIPEEHARFIDMVVFGCVEPKMDLQAAVALGKNHPVEFSGIANQIMMLTGQGRSAKKSPQPLGRSRRPNLPDPGRCAGPVSLRDPARHLPPRLDDRHRVGALGPVLRGSQQEAERSWLILRKL